jgi:hypothetical protein
MAIVAAALLFGAIVAFAQPAVPSNPRIALVIGNGSYTGSIPSLANPSNDAQDIGAALQAAGWQVLQAQNANRRDMNRRLSDFRDRLKANPGATALFFYAGHGVQLEGKNYLLPIGEEFENPDDVKESAFLVDRVVDAFDEAAARQSVILLDACRDNPFPKKTRSIGQSRGLAVVPADESAEEGSAVIFATAPNDVAADGEGRNGIFTGALLRHIDGGLDLQDMFKVVRDEVRSLTGGKQNPSIVTSGLLGKLYLGKAGPANPQAPVVGASLAAIQLSVKGPVAGMKVYVDGAVAGETPFSTSLPGGVHTVELIHPDWAPYTQAIGADASGLVEIDPKLEHSPAWRLSYLQGDREALEGRLGLVKRHQRAWRTAGLVGFITAGGGALSAVTGLVLGDRARAGYDAATDANSALGYKSRINSATIVYQAGIIGGGLGLLAGILSFVLAPRTTQLDQDLQDVDAQIQGLGVAQ